MATRKAASSTKTKKTTTPRAKAASSSASSKVTRVSAKAAPSRKTTSSTGSSTSSRLDSNVVNIVLAEIIGTFVLTLVALLTFQNVMPLYVGLTLVLLVFTIGATSGSHVNPAVTFGLWAAGKLKSVLVPFYWGAQFIGAIAAFFLLNSLAGNSLGLDFAHFNDINWSVFTVELVGTAVFLLGLTAVVSRADISAAGRSVGIGLSLMAGLLVASSLYAPAYQSAVDTYNQARSAVAEDGDEPTIPHVAYVKGATLNPAIALASTESTNAELGVPTEEENEPRYSRFGWEVILSTLIGGALGANLARLLNYRFRI